MTKVRGRHDHLTKAEIEIVRLGFEAGRKPADLAAELNCDERSIYRRFRNLREDERIKARKADMRAAVAARRREAMP